MSSSGNAPAHERGERGILIAGEGVYACVAVDLSELIWSRDITFVFINLSPADPARCSYPPKRRFTDLFEAWWFAPIVNHMGDVSHVNFRRVHTGSTAER
jgi:hypothetical protein